MLFFSFFTYEMSAQNVSLTNAKKGDFVLINGKKFSIQTDDGDYWFWRRINNIFYVDSVHTYLNSSLVKTVDKVHLTDGKDVRFYLYMDYDVDNSYYDLSYYSDIMVCDTCDPKGNYIPYICNDSLAFGSTHPSRPFMYGYNFNFEQCKKFLSDIEFMDLHPGQKIASVGAASGWYEGALSVNTENISYTIQDVDPYVLNEEQFNAVVKHFMSVSEKTASNDFDFVLGNFDSTCLPRGKFDKIIIRNAYHEFTNKWKMVHDLKSKIKPEGGEIILMDEGFSSLYYTYYHEGCGVRSLQAKEVIRFFGEQGLFLTKMKLPLNSLDNNLIFSTDKKKSAEYLKSLEEVNKIMFKVDRLNTSPYASDEEYVLEVEDLLKENLNTIHTTYDSLHNYLSDIASNWTETDHYDYALNILKVSDNLYPDYAYTQFYLGIVHYGLEDRKKGDEYFAKTIALEKTRKKDIDDFKKQWIEWWGE